MKIGWSGRPCSGLALALLAGLLVAAPAVAQEETGTQEQAEAQAQAGDRWRFSLGAAYGESSTDIFNLRRGGFGLLARAEWNRLGFEVAAHRIGADDPVVVSFADDGSSSEYVIPLGTRHLLGTYRFELGSVAIRPGLGIAWWESDSHPAIGLSVGVPVLRRAAWDLSVELAGRAKLPIGEDSSDPPRVVALQGVVTLPGRDDRSRPPRPSPVAAPRQPRGESPWRFGAGLAYGATWAENETEATTEDGIIEVSHVVARLGLGLVGRAEWKRLGVEVAAYHVAGEEPLLFEIVKPGESQSIGTVPMGSQHVLATYRVDLGPLVIRPGLGGAWYQSVSDGTLSDPAMALSVGVPVLRRQAWDLSVEVAGRTRLPIGEGSIHPRDVVVLRAVSTFPGRRDPSPRPAPATAPTQPRGEPRWRFSAGLAYGQTSTDERDASASGLGALARVEWRRYGLEVAAHFIDAENPIFIDPPGAIVNQKEVSLRTQHLLATYRLTVGSLAIRPGLGIVWYEAEGFPAVTKSDPAMALSIGVPVFRRPGLELHAELIGRTELPIEGDSSDARHLVVAQAVVTLPVR